MSFVFIRKSSFIARGGTEDNHVSFRIFFLRFQCYATGGSKHTAITLCTTETSIQKDHYIIVVQSAQFRIEFVERVASFCLLTVGVNRKQESVFSGFVGDAVAGIVEHYFYLSRISIGYIFDITHGT